MKAARKGINKSSNDAKSKHEPSNVTTTTAAATTQKIEDIENNTNNEQNESNMFETTMKTISFTNNDKPATVIRERLVGLAQSFSGFEKQIQKTKEKKKEDDEQKIIQIKNDLEILHNNIQLESKRREETVTAVHTMFSSQIISVRKEIETPIYQKIDRLIESLDHLSKHIDNIEQKHEIDRKNFPIQIETRSSALLKQINEFKARFEADVASREHKDKVLQKIITEQEFQVQKMLESERVERETKVARLQNDIDIEARMRAKASKSIQEAHKANMDILHSNINKIQNQREIATEEVVKALVHYTAALHDGVKIVSEAG